MFRLKFFHQLIKKSVQFFHLINLGRHANPGLTSSHPWLLNAGRGRTCLRVG